jgi:GIY-YIG catalytic domain
MSVRSASGRRAPPRRGGRLRTGNVLDGATDTSKLLLPLAQLRNGLLVLPPPRPRSRDVASFGTLPRRQLTKSLISPAPAKPATHPHPAASEEPPAAAAGQLRPAPTALAVMGTVDLHLPMPPASLPLEARAWADAQAEGRGCPQHRSRVLHVAREPAPARRVHRLISRTRKALAIDVGWGDADPTRVFSRVEILGRPSPVPAVPGVYAWYFAEIPGRADVSQCVRFDDLTLLYVGISPRKPPRTGETTSKMNLRTRIRQHYALNAEGSTLRLTLGRRGRRCYLFSPVDDRGEETPVGVARRPAQLRLAHVDGGRF